MDGPQEIMQMEGASVLPQFSRSLAACGMVLVCIIMELGEFTVDMGPQYFHAALASGMIERKKECPVWRITSNKNKMVSYGRTFPEALCKLLILSRFPQKQ
jgi:hypothetical protein